ncbi:MAG: hypothetical protein ABI673_07120 [Novosphingobium sp.]
MGKAGAGGMARKYSGIGWKHAVVAAICVADAAGIYAVRLRLNAPSPASQRQDAVAYGAPTQQFTFHPDTSLAAAAPPAKPRFVRVELSTATVVNQVAETPAPRLAMPEVRLTARAEQINAPVEAPRTAHRQRASHDQAFNAAFADSDSLGVIPDLTFDQQVAIADGKADPAPETPAMASLTPGDRQFSSAPEGELPALGDAVSAAQLVN